MYIVFFDATPTFSNCCRESHVRFTLMKICWSVLEWNESLFMSHFVMLSTGHLESAVLLSYRDHLSFDTFYSIYTAFLIRCFYTHSHQTSLKNWITFRLTRDGVSFCLIQKLSFFIIGRKHRQLLCLGFQFYSYL